MHKLLFYKKNYKKYKGNLIDKKIRYTANVLKTSKFKKTNKLDI